jgi:transposase
MVLSGGQRADVGFAASLLSGLRPQVVIADRGYDFDTVIASIERSGARAVIPSRRNRRVQRPTEWKLYGLRNIIERYIHKFKGFRRIATRYDKTDSSYLGFLYLAAAIINTKTTVNTT